MSDATKSWQPDGPAYPVATCDCGAMPLPLGGPEGGAVVHAESCPRGDITGIG
ncbi:hypothetical protein OG264_16170 [Streptomyces xanthophaeus]|uniref:hypothetical protein n=1 Tax=Streptomyces xanthophaeus TaxID=67385 RepID=UPI003866D57A|nr:hypothetical protein OG264_16170 [Streptomyces xanthophaeus]WST62129.1 hypothetical protein OG605_22265 [Streptomyces xanthophaeus]